MRMTKLNVYQLLTSTLGFGNLLLSGVDVNRILGKEKGQKRNAKSKASGVAASKRLATKRNNIRKHG